jgi:hypothetical protein
MNEKLQFIEKFLWGCGLLVCLLLSITALVLAVIGISEDHAHVRAEQELSDRIKTQGKVIGDHLEFDHGDKSRGLSR